MYNPGLARRRAVLYRLPSGVEPYARFVDRLPDRLGAAKIRARVSRAELGNLGDHRGIGRGIIELRIQYGPGYRVYAGLKGKDLIVLLCAGDKSTQRRDITRAQAYWKDFEKRP